MILDTSHESPYHYHGARGLTDEEYDFNFRHLLPMLELEIEALKAAASSGIVHSPLAAPRPQPTIDEYLSDNQEPESK